MLYTSSSVGVGGGQISCFCGRQGHSSCSSRSSSDGRRLRRSGCRLGCPLTQPLLLDPSFVLPCWGMRGLQIKDEKVYVALSYSATSV